MKNRQLINELSDKTGHSPEEVSSMLSTFAEVLGTCLLEDDVVFVQDFGQFEQRKRGERVSVNPTNGKRYLVPPKLIAAFKPASALKEKLKTISTDE
jgi:nucleoid DNA-binding protein